MRAQMAARLMPKSRERSAPETAPSPAARKALKMWASTVIGASRGKIQGDVHRRGRMRQRADRNEVHARFGDGADRGKIDAAAGLSAGAASDESDSGAELFS